MTAEHLPGRLRELREAASLTQKQLAEKVGVKWLAVSRWESGDREPGWSNILALAAALGVDCRAFDQEPASPPAEPKRGRPPKPAPESPPAAPHGAAETSKKRGRPPKASR